MRPQRKGQIMSEQKFPTIGIFVERNGVYVPLNVLCDQLLQKKKLIEKKKEILKKQQDVIKKKLRNNKCCQINTACSLLLYLLSFGAVLFCHNPKIKNAGVSAFALTWIADKSISTVLTRKRKKLEKESDYWEKQYRDLERE